MRAPGVTWWLAHQARCRIWVFWGFFECQAQVLGVNPLSWASVWGSLPIPGVVASSWAGAGSILHLSRVNPEPPARGLVRALYFGWFCRAEMADLQIFVQKSIFLCHCLIRDSSSPWEALAGAKCGFCWNKELLPRSFLPLALSSCKSEFRQKKWIRV